MRALIYFIRSLVYSNLFVSLCITLLAHQTYILLKIPQENCFNVLAFIFCSTFFTYNFQRIFRFKSVDLLGKLIGVRLGWIIRNRKKLFIASFFFGLMCIIFLLQLNFKVFLLIIPFALLSVMYVIPFLPKKKAIRDLPHTKVFVIALVWSFVMVVIPLVNFNGYKDLMDSSFLLLLLEQFLFILAITLPFDVRDLRYDLEANIRTIPSTIGVKKTIVLSHVLLVTFLMLKFIQYYYLSQINLAQFLATLITTGLAIIIIAFTSTKRGELFFSGFVDGIMILMYLGILLLEY